MNRIIFALLLGTTISQAAPQTAKQQFELNCLACHQVENKNTPVVGPSLVEMNHLYKDDLKGFIKWCNAPGKKRQNAIQMPSMAHVGDKGLTEIHAWIKEVTKGKKFQPNAPAKKAKPWEVIKDSDKPRLQRIFMPYSSPASMAVTIDGKHSFCWDTVSCRLRYIWDGGYIDGNPYWKGNGSRLANLLGVIYYEAPKDLSAGVTQGDGKTVAQFRGYKLVGGLPEFHYTLGKATVSESYSNKNGGVQVHVKITGAEGKVRYPLGDLAKTNLIYSAGKIINGALELTQKEAASFKMIFNPKK